MLPRTSSPCHVNKTQAYNVVICSHTLICNSTLGKSALIVTHVHSPKAQKLLHVGPREQDGSSQSRPQTFLFMPPLSIEANGFSLQHIFIV